jgi:APA family basic amino acid/polyamine antiporter
MDKPLDSSDKKGLFATKPIADYQEEAAGRHLVRALGIPALIAFGIGGIIGTGIFVLTGLAAAQHAGPAIVISFVIAGIGCMFAGLCYSEFAAMVPVCGSAYAYSYATLGEIIAWFVGWNLVLEYMMACSTVAVGWSRYFVAFLELFHLHCRKRSPARRSPPARPAMTSMPPGRSSICRRC